MNQKTTLLPYTKENHMSKKKDTGIFQLDNGNWGFRYAIKINGKPKESKRYKMNLENLLSQKHLLSKQENKLSSMKK